MSSTVRTSLCSSIFPIIFYQLDSYKVVPTNAVHVHLVQDCEVHEVRVVRSHGDFLELFVRLYLIFCIDNVTNQSCARTEMQK